MKRPAGDRSGLLQWLAAASAALLCCLFVACEAPQAIESAPQAKAASSLPDSSSEHPPDDAVKGENPDLGDAIMLDMSYTELRKAIRARGWTPVRDESCMINLIGQDHATFCAAHPESQRCGYCSQLPGLKQCSADGYCLFLFEHALDRRWLEVGMQGELENWRYNAPDTMFGVSGWRYLLNGED